MDLHIRPLDLSIVAVYLAAVLGSGWYFGRRSGTAENYFVGKRAFPGWLAGLSMLGSTISSTTFLALPAAAYILDWRQLDVNLVLPFVAVLAVVVFIPLFRRAGLISAFEYLGDRFGTGARLYGTISFVVLQLFRTAQILYLVALPMQFLTGIPLRSVILGATAFTALFVVVGGMESVMWANAVQATIMLIGGWICLLFIGHFLPGGLEQILTVGGKYHKFSLGSFEWNMGERTFWTVAILGLVHWLTIYAGEQTMVQRYVAARSTREARKGVILFSAVALPMWVLFFFLGTALFVYYRAFPDPQVVSLEADQVLPYFVLTRIPAGLAGVVIASVLSAAMSSLNSAVNSISAVTVVDIVKPHLAPGRSERFYLNTARLASGTAVALTAAGAMALDLIKKESMNDISLTVASVMGGCLTGIFMLGFFSRRIDGGSVVRALVGAMALNVYLALCFLGIPPPAWRPPIHSYWIGPIVNLVFVVLAWGFSLVRNVPQRDLAGLTVWTLLPGEPAGRNSTNRKGRT